MCVCIINYTHDVVEAHFYTIQCRQIDCEFCTQLTKAFVAKMSCNQSLIDSATYLLTINSPTNYTHTVDSISMQYSVQMDHIVANSPKCVF